MSRLTALWLDWQKGLLPLIGVLCVAWALGRGAAPDSDGSWFLLLLIVYMAHQVEEHFWPGGFRQFANAHVFKTGLDGWPVGRGGVALVNVGFVWAPLLAAALFPDVLRWVGIAWMGLTAVNAVTHIITGIRIRPHYNPGLVTSIVLFLPFTIAYFHDRLASGAMSGADVVTALVLGALLHLPVAAVFVVPYRRGLGSPGPAKAG
jgi:hypothetical protein